VSSAEARSRRTWGTPPSAAFADGPQRRLNPRSSAPASIHCGIAGIVRPGRSASTAGKISDSPYWASNSAALSSAMDCGRHDDTES
jgi:hypothetical protein